MAKKNKKEELMLEDEPDRAGSKILTFLIAIFIVIIWLGIFALVVKLDIGGLGSNVLRPVLKDVPLINKILPAVPDTQLADENNYKYKNLTEAIERIQELEAQLDSSQSATSTKSGKVKELQAEIKRLKEFEDNQKEFEKMKDDFYEEIVLGDSAPDPENYKTWYEAVEPDKAQELYKQIVAQMEADKKVEALAERYSAMEPAAAATILDTMTGSVDLVAEILNTMDAEQAALIMAEMDSTFAAKISLKMSGSD